MQKFQQNVQDQFGNEISLPLITVRNVVGGALSSLFSDNGVTPLANPFVAQDISEFFFYAANGRYDIFITGPVIDQSLDVLLFDPIDDAATDASTTRTGDFFFDADVTGIDPEAESIKFNNADPALVTNCLIALEDQQGTLVADLTALSLVGSRMRVWDELDPTFLQEYVVATVPALDVDHYTFTVDFIAGAASMPVDDRSLRVQFELTSYLGAGITSGDQNSMLYWDQDRAWLGTDAVQLDPAANPARGHLNTVTGGGTDRARAMLYQDVGNDTGGLLYSETEPGEGFYLYSDFDGAPRSWAFGYDDGSNNNILLFEDSPLSLRIPSAVRFQIGEKAAAGADEAGEGQFWVRNDAPNTPMFTDDAGNDFDLSAGAAGTIFRGCKAHSTINIVLPNDAAPAFPVNANEIALALNAETIDTDAIHDNAVNNTRLTVPAGISRVILRAGATMAPALTGLHHLRMRKNGGSATIQPGMGILIPHYTIGAGGSGSDKGMHSFSSGVIDVSPGDYFELYGLGQNNTTTLRGGDIWFEMEIKG